MKSYHAKALYRAFLLVFLFGIAGELSLIQLLIPFWLSLGMALLEMWLKTFEED